MRTFPESVMRTAPFACLLCLAVALLSSAPARAQQPPPLTGVVLDTSGGIVPGALVSLRVGPRRVAETVSDAAGRFAFDTVPPGIVTLSVDVPGFSTSAIDVLPANRGDVRLVLQPLAVSETLTVRAQLPERAGDGGALRTDTPLRDVPQAITVISRDVIAAQGMQNLADLVRFVPGVGMAQGEGNRDAAVFRGNASTADFFVDGVRDDVQYFRDLYNVERVEVLKGANAMLFGRGGAGGVLNRVTRQANWSPAREVTVQAGSFGDRRATVDLGGAFTKAVAARVTGLYEQADSYRQGVGLEHYGVNPTVALALGERTIVTAGYERFHDQRTADRGIPSHDGKPVAVSPTTFFGDPDRSQSRVTVDALTVALDHRLGGRVRLRNRARFAAYDKFYQNVYPGAVTGGTSVALSAYNHATRRDNVFNQADVVVTAETGRVRHTILTGAELGRQETDNLRTTGYFDGVAPSLSVPVSAPTISRSLVFRALPSDADNHGVATTAAVYVQDQAELSRRVQVVGGVRYERFGVDLLNNRTRTTLTATDHLVSPRAGIVFKPAVPVSLYASYSLAYVPRAGEQLASLSPTNRALEPEQFRNYEVGAKWDALGRVAVTAALYRLDRRNVAVPDAQDPTRSVLVDGQRARGLEVGIDGRPVRALTLLAAYAYQDGEITRSLSATARAGARLPQLPAHSLSVWGKYDITSRLGAAAGVVRRGALFASTDNLVVVPAFTRLDAALFVAVAPRLRLQANAENVLDTRYYASAHNNQNITPGSPRALRVSVTTVF